LIPPNASARDQVKTDEPIYITAAELARQVHVDNKTIYRWAQQEPSMPVLRIRGVVRFPRERALRWLAEHEQGQARPRRSASIIP
jgi:excisionase family DNA binding protein